MAITRHSSRALHDDQRFWHVDHLDFFGSETQENDRGESERTANLLDVRRKELSLVDDNLWDPTKSLHTHAKPSP